MPDSTISPGERSRDRPQLEEHFVHASLLGLLRRRHPYDFIETYEILERVYGYRSGYVNMGLWEDGADTVEPGRCLALRVLDELALEPGGRLVDAGSGLGQAAVDACHRHALGSVLGINPNPRQVAYANALAARAGLAERIHHEVADACTRLAAEPAGSADGVAAIECVGHFARPADFLAGAHRVLRPGGRIAFCLNVAGRPFDAWQRVVAHASYGFTPAPLVRWAERLRAAGFAQLRSEDLTSRVLEVAIDVLPRRLREHRGASLPLATRSAMSLSLYAARRAVERRQLRYALVSATRPAD